MLKIHFLNVGHGDCIVVEFLDTQRTAVIDINTTDSMDRKTSIEILGEIGDFETLGQLGEVLMFNDDQRYDSFLESVNFQERFKLGKYDIALTNPITYLSNKNVTEVFRFVSTHPHMDHLSGLSSLFSNFTVQNFWVVDNSHTQNQKKLTSSQVLDWNLYKTMKNLNPGDKHNGTTIIKPREKELGDFWQQDGIHILYPPSGLNTNTITDPNKISYVLLIKYKTHKIVLGGDADESIWKYIYENYKEAISNVSVLKASHHGRDTGYHQESVKQMNPVYTIVSVGKKPSTDASNKYRQYCNNVWSTRWKGNIVFNFNDDGTWNNNTEYDR